MEGALKWQDTEKAEHHQNNRISKIFFFKKKKKSPPKKAKEFAQKVVPEARRRLGDTGIAQRIESNAHVLSPVFFFSFPIFQLHPSLSSTISFLLFVILSLRLGDVK